MEYISLNILYKSYLELKIKQLIKLLSNLNCELYISPEKLKLDYSYEYENKIYKHIHINLQNLSRQVIENILDTYVSNIPKLDLKYLLEITNKVTNQTNKIYIDKNGHKIVENNFQTQLNID